MDSSSSRSDVVEYLKQNVGEEAAKVFEEAGLDGKLFLMLKRDDINELLPGAKYFLARKKILHLVENVKLGYAGEAAPPPTTATPEQPKKAVSSTLAASPTAMPEFPIYADDGKKIDRNQLVRITIGNMRTCCFNLDPPREPIALELENMARRLVAKYPELSDDRTLNPNKPWEGLLKALKRRLGNAKPVLNPQGKTPNRGKKREHTEEPLNEPKENAEPEKKVLKPAEDISESEESEDEAVYNPKEMAKHHDKILDQSKKPKPNSKAQSEDEAVYNPKEMAKHQDKTLHQAKKQKPNSKAQLENEAVYNPKEMAKHQDKTLHQAKKQKPNSKAQSEDEAVYNPKEMAKHHDKILDQLKKQKPNSKVITQLMDLEFRSRRAWITNASETAESVSAKIARVSKAYPCFSYPCQTQELLEETRRIVASGGCNPGFVDEAMQHMEEAWGRMLSFGLSSGKLDPVNGSSKDSKVIALLTAATAIFPGKRRGKNIATIIDEKRNLDKTIKASQEPELLISKTHILVVGGQRILVKIPRSQDTCWELGMLSLIGVYYAFDLGYPAGQENVLLLIQSTVLKDKVHPEDATKRYATLMKGYRNCQ